MAELSDCMHAAADRAQLERMVCDVDVRYSGNFAGRAGSE
jgi:hypothetical protein